MIRNKKALQAIEQIKSVSGENVNDPMNFIEQYIERLERENFGLRQTNANYHEKEERRYVLEGNRCRSVRVVQRRRKI